MSVISTSSPWLHVGLPTHSILLHHRLGCGWYICASRGDGGYLLLRILSRKRFASSPLCKSAVGVGLSRIPFPPRAYLLLSGWSRSELSASHSSGLANVFFFCVFFCLPDSVPCVTVG